jgi:hypothetical protein
MRQRSVRWLVRAGLATIITTALTVFAPATAHADDCYTVWVSGKPTTICPWQ